MRNKIDISPEEIKVIADIIDVFGLACRDAFLAQDIQAAANAHMIAVTSLIVWRNEYAKSEYRKGYSAGYQRSARLGDIVPVKGTQGHGPRVRIKSSKGLNK